LISVVRYEIMGEDGKEMGTKRDVVSKYNINTFKERPADD